VTPEQLKRIRTIDEFMLQIKPNETAYAKEWFVAWAMEWLAEKCASFAIDVEEGESKNPAARHVWRAWVETEGGGGLEDYPKGNFSLLDTLLWAVETVRSRNENKKTNS